MEWGGENGLLVSFIDKASNRSDAICARSCAGRTLLVNGPCAHSYNNVAAMALWLKGGEQKVGEEGKRSIKRKGEGCRKSKLLDFYTISRRTSRSCDSLHRIDATDTSSHWCKFLPQKCRFTCGNYFFNFKKRKAFKMGSINAPTRQAKKRLTIAAIAAHCKSMSCL